MKKLLIGIAGVFIFAGCASIVPVTDNIIEQVGGEDQLKNFQYYVSRSIVLDRTENQTEAGVQKGKANIVQKIDKDKVTIKGSTPGVVLRYRTQRLLGSPRYILTVGFEPSDDYFLEFMKYNDQKDSPYYMVVHDNEHKIVGYGSSLYQYSFPEKGSIRSWIGLGKDKQADATPPHLLIKLNKKLIKNVNKRTAKGRTLK